MLHYKYKKLHDRAGQVHVNYYFTAVKNGNPSNGSNIENGNTSHAREHLSPYPWIHFHSSRYKLSGLLSLGWKNVFSMSRDTCTEQSVFL